jgi:hypothetical protein
MVNYYAIRSLQAGWVSVAAAGCASSFIGIGAKERRPFSVLPSMFLIVALSLSWQIIIARFAIGKLETN